MKKLWTVFLLIFIVCLIKPEYNFCNLSAEYKGTHCFYSSQKIFDNNATTIKNGNGFIISCSTLNAKSIKNKINNNFLYGESFSFKGNKEQINAILKKLKVNIVRQENLNELYVLEGYTNLLNESIMLGEDKINIQIAYNDGIITVGYPLILGGF